MACVAAPLQLRCSVLRPLSALHCVSDYPIALLHTLARCNFATDETYSHELTTCCTSRYVYALGVPDVLSLGGRVHNLCDSLLPTVGDLLPPQIQEWIWSVRRAGSDVLFYS